MPSKIAALPIVGSDDPCIIDADYLHWFIGKKLCMDPMSGCVYYTLSSDSPMKRYYVHDQVSILSVRDGYKPTHTTRTFRQFVKSKADPDVLQYYFAK